MQLIRGMLAGAGIKTCIAGWLVALGCEALVVTAIAATHVYARWGHLSQANQASRISLADALADALVCCEGTMQVYTGAVAITAAQY